MKAGDKRIIVRRTRERMKCRQVERKMGIRKGDTVYNSPKSILGSEIEYTYEGAQATEYSPSNIVVRLIVKSVANGHISFRDPDTITKSKLIKV